MLNIGLSEILLIGALLLVVVGPEKLPRVLRWVGMNYAKLRRAANELQHAFMDEADLAELGLDERPLRPPLRKKVPARKARQKSVLQQQQAEAEGSEQDEPDPDAEASTEDVAPAEAPVATAEPDPAEPEEGAS